MINKWIKFKKVMAWINVIISIVSSIVVLTVSGILFKGVLDRMNWYVLIGCIWAVLQAFFILAIIMVYCFIAEKLGEIS